jgi:hypothetical protein
MRSKWTVAALACACLILVLGPLVLTLLRADEYTSTAELSFSTDNTVGRQLDQPRSFVAGPLKLRDLQRAVARRVDWIERPDDVPEYVSVREAAGADADSYLLEARGAGPEEAQALATAASEEVLRAAETAAQFLVHGELRGLNRRLRRGEIERSELEAARARRDDFQELADRGMRVFSQSPGPATLPAERAADRLLGALPGDRPIRPNPVWAGLAGLALAVALLVWVLVLLPTDPRSRPSPRG